MKRSVLLLFSVHLFTMAFSQITIKRTDYTVSGIVADTSSYRDLSIDGLAIPIRGNNRIYDYTTIRDTNQERRSVNTPGPLVGTVLPSNFADATFVSRPQPAFGTYAIVDTQFRRLDEMGLYILGYKRGTAIRSITTNTGGTADSLYILGRDVRYTSPAFQLKFPMTSTTSVKVVTIDTFPYQLTYAAAGYTKAEVKFIRRSEYTTEIVGWGTLKLRHPTGGAPLNFGVLFERNSETRLDSFFLNGQLMPKRILDTFRIVQGRRDTATMTYNLRGMGFKRGILQFIMSPNEAFLTGANRVIEPSMGLLIGTKEFKNLDLLTTISPNPVTAEVNLTFDKKTNGTWHAMIYNEVGQIIDLQSISAPKGTLTHRIALDKSLPSGNYFINILDESSLIRSNGRFVKL